MLVFNTRIHLYMCGYFILFFTLQTTTTMATTPQKSREHDDDTARRTHTPNSTTRGFPRYIRATHGREFSRKPPQDTVRRRTRDFRCRVESCSEATKRNYARSQHEWNTTAKPDKADLRIVFACSHIFVLLKPFLLDWWRDANAIFIRCVRFPTSGEFAIFPSHRTHLAHNHFLTHQAIVWSK